MRDTPFFDAWIHRLAPLGSRTAKAVARVRARTLCQLENRFRQWLPEDLFPKAAQAVKRKKNRYPRLVGPCRKFRDHLKRNDRRKISRLRKLGLM